MAASTAREDFSCLLTLAQYSQKCVLGASDVGVGTPALGAWVCGAMTRSVTVHVEDLPVPSEVRERSVSFMRLRGPVVAGMQSLPPSSSSWKAPDSAGIIYVEVRGT